MLLPKLGLVWMLSNCGAFTDLGAYQGPCFFLEMSDCIVASEVVKEDLNMAIAPECYYQELPAEVG